MRYHSAGGILVSHFDNETRFLVIHQRRKNGELQWVMPKGGLEPGETPEGAARREIQEEVGLDALHLIGPAGGQAFQFKDQSGADNQKTVDWFVFRADAPEQLKLNRDEGFIDAHWLSYRDARLRLTHPEFVAFLDRAQDMLHATGD
jgi:8-oxo-dGTP pyrophosphatase MutT (NUDIX family)